MAALITSFFMKLLKTKANKQEGPNMKLLTTVIRMYFKTFLILDSNDRHG